MRVKYMQNHTRSTAHGFTLIELLVVIAIIGLLASVVLASTGTARAKGRDARRISDVKQIQLALALYYDANSEYPTSLSTLAPNYISTLPTDPSTNSNYSYAALQGSATAQSTCGSYHLGASLETSQSDLSNDADGTTGGTYGSGKSDGTVCTNGGTDFNGNAVTCGGSSGTDECFDVKP